MPRPVVRVAIAGFGTVGRAVGEMLLTRRERYRRLYGVDVRLVAVCGSASGLSAEAGIEADRFDALEKGKSGPAFIAASGADVLIEAGPTDRRTGAPGLAYIRSALSDGCDVIVISKGALVVASRDLRERARASGAVLKVSGAAGAALPTIDLLQYALKGSAIRELEGILNATTNALLDDMMTNGTGFEAALRRGRATNAMERDPSNDVEGWDTACKLLILANFGLGADLTLDDIRVQGIQHIDENEIEDWKARGLVPKLVGTLTREGDAWRAEVAVRTYRPGDRLAMVSGTDKAIRIVAEAMGDLFVTISGDEPASTAAAVLKDFEHILQKRGSER